MPIEASALFTSALVGSRLLLEGFWFDTGVSNMERRLALTGKDVEIKADHQKVGLVTLDGETFNCTLLSIILCPYPIPLVTSTG